MFVKCIANVSVKSKVRQSFVVQPQSFMVRSDTDAEGVVCTFRHTVQHINDHSWWGPRTFLVGTANVPGSVKEKVKRS
jgi:hypothetical protein